MSKRIDLSIIILNYNSADYLRRCLKSISRSNLGNYAIETIVVDNASTDLSLKLAQKDKHKWVKYLVLKKNLGFAAGNNQGVKIINPNTKYVLFLNPDTIVQPKTLKTMIDFFNRQPDASAATCYIKLAKTGQMQPECHRGFPTPWRSFCYFSGISKLFPKSKFFNGYFLGHLDTSTIHPIEACVGAFLMVKKSVGQNINWWNESYFFYGEDLDFCYQLYQKKYKLYFNPHCQITHFQGISSGIKSQSQKLSSANRSTKILAAKSSTEAMKIFYQRNLFSKYNFFTRQLVLGGIKLLEIKRLFKAKYL
ncbi:MAG TPA: glycosyltransferase family 2 protein [Candidatus Woesebacteria bacterium]|jgi:GT2 family glycosyltransferase|nr:glycosyltransferase family 2 protein [Candidatus Woesebacteria bacterium]HOG37348.1 glycosyltransferase family 2 protein [Candidatus Woesebacteria bacterium]